jgi:hypothetical protein
MNNELKLLCKELVSLYHDMFRPRYREVKSSDYLYTVKVISTGEIKEIEAYNLDNVAYKLNLRDKDELLYISKNRL